jgi:hypothetical protein
MQKKEILLEKIKLLYNSFNKRQGWYTGLAIKKYLKKEVFGLKKDFVNPAIIAGRWSAYCHYSLILSFTNMLHKNAIQEGSLVVVHPLLPAPLIDQLTAMKCKVVSLDIEKNSLAFDPQKLISYIRQLRASGTTPDLVIHYGFNGLYESTRDSIKEIQKLAVPSLVVIGNPNLNLSLLDLFESLTLGGVIWDFGDSFLDDHLNEVLDINLQTQNWYVSWSIETRTRSLLEYHLSKSYDVYEEVLEAYFFLLLGEYKKQDWKGILYQYLANKYLLKHSFKDTKEAAELVKTKYPELFHAAVPDTIFDLQIKFPEKYPKSDLELIYHSSDLQQRAKKLYNYFNQNISARPAGSLEIPDFYLDRTYLKYFVYTTEPKYWQEYLGAMGFKISNLSQIHGTFWQKPALANANFVTKFLISVDLCDQIK